MTREERARQYAEKLIAARDSNRAAAEIAADISTLYWPNRPGQPYLTYNEKIGIVDMVSDILAPPVDEMTRLGGDNTKTLQLIQAIRAMIK